MIIEEEIKVERKLTISMIYQVKAGVCVRVKCVAVLVGKRGKGKAF